MHQCLCCVAAAPACKVPLLRSCSARLQSASAHCTVMAFLCRPSDKFEDGTLSFLDIISLQHGFDFIDKTLGGVEAIQDHCHALTATAYARLKSLHHSNGAPVVQIFGQHAAEGAESRQGAIVNFEVLDPEGKEFSYRYVERAAAETGFHIRAGAQRSLCTPMRIASELVVLRRVCCSSACLHWVQVAGSDMQRLSIVCFE